MPKFEAALDLNKNELQNGVVQNLTSAPGSPVAGQAYFDTTLHQFGVYNGTSWAYLVPVAGFLLAANNLSDLASASTARTNLGLGSAATQASSAFDAAGAAAAEATRATAAEALLAPKASPALTGTPTAPTATALTSTTQLATTAYADSAVGVETSRATTAEGLLIPLSQKAANSGVASLDSGGHVPTAQIPSLPYDASGAAATAQTNAENFATSTFLPLAGGTVSGSSAGGGLLAVVNSHTTPTSPTVQYTAQTAADLVLGVEVSGDTVPRLTIDSNGQLQWGAGGSSAVDTNLQRGGASLLSTSARFQVQRNNGSGGMFIVSNTQGAPTAPSSQFTSHSAADLAVGFNVSGDTVYRLTIDSNGKMSWGPGGSTAADTVLQRSGAGVLQLTTGVLNMNSQKITSLANGSAASDAAAFGQIPTSASTIGGLLAASNLSDLASASTARTNLGLGTAALLNTPIGAGSLTGVVTGVTAGDASVAVGGTSAAPTLETGTLDQIANLHPPAANWSNNSKKITALANGSAASDAVAFGQVMSLQAATAVAGYTLVNGTGTIISWTAPSDGQLHRFTVLASQDVTVTEVGGQIQLNVTLPDASINGQNLFGPNGAAGTRINSLGGIVEAGSTVLVKQNSALTSGAAVTWAEIWAL